jgi:hypothetical protein
MMPEHDLQKRYYWWGTPEERRLALGLLIKYFKAIMKVLARFLD